MIITHHIYSFVCGTFANFNLRDLGNPLPRPGSLRDAGIRVNIHISDRQDMHVIRSLSVYLRC